MKLQKIALQATMISASLLFGTSSISTVVQANQADGYTDFAVTYYDASGFSVGAQRIHVAGNGSTVTLREDMLHIPGGYVLSEPFGTYSTDSMGSLEVPLQVTSVEPALEDIYDSQSKNSVLEVALTINYWTEDDALVDSQTFQVKHRATAGSAVYPLHLSQDYSIDVPEGYTLLSSYQDQYNVPLQGRKVVNLYVAPDDGTVTADPTADGDDIVTYVHCFYYDADGNLVGTQDIPYYGPGEIVLDPALLIMPNGWQFDEEWMTYYTDAGEDLYVNFQVAPYDGTHPYVAYDDAAYPSDEEVSTYGVTETSMTTSPVLAASSASGNASAAVTEGDVPTAAKTSPWMPAALMAVSAGAGLLVWKKKKTNE